MCRTTRRAENCCVIEFNSFGAWSGCGSCLSTGREIGMCSMEGQRKVSEAGLPLWSFRMSI